MVTGRGGRGLLRCSPVRVATSVLVYRNAAVVDMVGGMLIHSGLAGWLLV